MANFTMRKFCFIVFACSMFVSCSGEPTKQISYVRCNPDPLAEVTGSTARKYYLDKYFDDGSIETIVGNGTCPEIAFGFTVFPGN